MKRKFYRTIAGMAILSMIALMLTGCNHSEGNNQAAEGTNTGGSGGSNYWINESGSSVNVAEDINLHVDYSDFDTLETWDDSACTITLNGSSASISGSGASVMNAGFCTVKITEGGTYVISGTLENGQIYVEAGENQVHLILNGVTIMCKTSAPIYLNNGKKTVLTLAEGSENILIDGTEYTDMVTETDEETGEVTGEPNAVLFSKKALTINGGGMLSITGNFNNGITCKDDFKAMNGNITISAKNHGIRGNDSVVVKDGAIHITTSEGDGVKSTKEGNPEKGYVYVEGGTISIAAGDDGIQASTAISVTGGTISIAAGDDAMHADGTLTIGGGTVEISECYEGLEGLVVNVAGGRIHLNAEDDGLNASAGSTADGTEKKRGIGDFGGFGGFGEGGGMQYESSCQINISGGYLYVEAGGDGIDSNGDLTINGGSVIVNGPANDGNGALDANGAILVNGGFLVAVGSSGMAEYPEGTSAQNVIITTFSQRQQAGTLVRVIDGEENDLLTFTPSKTYNSVIFSSPDIRSGMEYTVYSGGSYSNGTESDGLMAGGTYTGGTSYGSVTVSTILSYVGTIGGNMGGGRPGGMGGGERPRR